MIKRFFGLVFGVAALSAGMAASAATVLKMATLAPEQSVFARSMRDLAKDIASKSGGAVKLRIYPGGVQGDEKTVLRKMRIGQLHGAGLLGSGLARVCPELQAVHVPLTFRSEAEVDYVLGKVAPVLEADSRKRGYEIIGWPRVGGTYLFSKDDVRDLAGLRQAKPCVLPQDLIGKTFFEEAKVSPVPVDVGDVLMGLQSGMLRSIVAPPVGMVAMQWFSRVEYRLDLPLTHAVGGVVISARAWKKLSPPHREVIREAAARHIAKLNEAVLRQNREALEAMAGENIKTVSPADGAVAELEAVCKQVAARLEGKAFSPEIRKLILENVTAFRANGGGN